MNIDNDTEDQGDFDRALGSVKKEKQEINQVIETTKDLMIELLRIQKQIDLYVGRDERFVKNIQLLNLLDDLKSFRNDIDEKQKKVKQYIADKKAMTLARSSLLEGSLFSSQSSLFTTSQESEFQEEGLELGALVIKTAHEIETYLDKINNLEIIVEYAVQSQFNSDCSEVMQILITVTQSLYTIHREGVTLCETLCKNKIKPLSNPNSSTQSEENLTFASLHYELRHIRASLESIDSNARDIHDAVEKNHLTPEDMLTIFNFCNHARRCIIQNQHVPMLIQKLLDDNNIHLSPLIVGRIRQSRENKKHG